MEEESIIITYESLYEILRREKFKEEIQDPPKDFIKKVVNFLNDKAGIIETQEKSVVSDFSGSILCLDCPFPIEPAVFNAKDLKK